MTQLVTGLATVECDFGLVPSELVVEPVARVTASDMPAATVNDSIPMMNVEPFGECSTPSNPEVAAATAAALGVLTPMPCLPVIVTPWEPGAATVLIGGAPALDATSTCQCIWGGTVSIVQPGQETVEVP